MKAAVKRILAWCHPSASFRMRLSSVISFKVSPPDHGVVVTPSNQGQDWPFNLLSGTEGFYKRFALEQRDLVGLFMVK